MKNSSDCSKKGNFKLINSNEICYRKCDTLNKRQEMKGVF